MISSFAADFQQHGTLELQFCSVTNSIARICCEEGQRWKLCHGGLTVDFGAGCSSCLMTNSFVTNAVLIE